MMTAIDDDNDNDTLISLDTVYTFSTSTNDFPAVVSFSTSHYDPSNKSCCRSSELKDTNDSSKAWTIVHYIDADPTINTATTTLMSSSSAVTISKPSLHPCNPSDDFFDGDDDGSFEKVCDVDDYDIISTTNETTASQLIVWNAHDQQDAEKPNFYGTATPVVDIPSSTASNGIGDDDDDGKEEEDNHDHHDYDKQEYEKLLSEQNQQSLTKSCLRHDHRSSGTTTSAKTSAVANRSQVSTREYCPCCLYFFKHALWLDGRTSIPFGGGCSSSSSEKSGCCSCNIDSSDSWKTEDKTNNNEHYDEEKQQPQKKDKYCSCHD